MQQNKQFDEGVMESPMKAFTPTLTYRWTNKCLVWRLGLETTPLRIFKLSTGS